MQSDTTSATARETKDLISDASIETIDFPAQPASTLDRICIPLLDKEASKESSLLCHDRNEDGWLPLGEVPYPWDRGD